MHITIINGPNLNLLGKREPEIYGNQSFEDFLEDLKKQFPQHTIDYYQSNVEGELINKIQEVGFKEGVILLNAGGYSHTSVSIADTVAAIAVPVIEIHISNIFAREAYRHHSLISTHCKGCVIGFGLKGYRMAIESLAY